MTLPFETLSDEQLIDALKAGNQSCFKEIARRYEKYILKKCQRYTKNEDEAEDLCQEVLIKIFTQAWSFRQEAKFSTWLYTIIHHTAIDQIRKQKKSSAIVIGKSLIKEIQEIADVQEELDEGKTIELLEQLLKEMDTDDKLILMLKYKEKHSIKDIQLTMNLSESAVKMRLKRAKAKINKLVSV